MITIIEKNSEAAPSSSPVDDYPGIPQEMKDTPHWLLWKFGTRAGTTKPTKLPVGISGRNINATTAKMSFNAVCEAMAAHPEKYSGIGFSFQKSDPFAAYDLDNVLDDAGEITDPEILAEVQALNSYTEISPSGRGLHVISRAVQEPDMEDGKRTGCRELYFNKHYFTITGTLWKGSTTEIREIEPETLRGIYQKVYGSKPTPPKTPQIPGKEHPQKTEEASISDVDIICRLKDSLRTKSLWKGDTSAYNGDNSAADMALCNEICYYTKSAQQIDSIFRRSGLIRVKWDEKRGKDTYGNITIAEALRTTTGQFKPSYKSRKNVANKEPHIYQDTEAHTLPADEITNTDRGNSQRLLIRHGDNIRCCTSAKTWHIWNKKCWMTDTGDRMLQLADDTAKAIYKEAGDNDTGRDLSSWGKKSESLKARRNMIEGAGTYRSVELEDLNAHEMLLNCKNGTLELDTMQFREHRREDLLTFVIKTKFLPEEACPLWEQHIKMVLKGNVDLIQFFQEMAGYSLFCGNPEQTMYILFGDGKNGKSVTCEVLAGILGEYAGSCDARALMPQRNNGPRSDLVRLDKKRLVLTSEPCEGMALDESLIKSITGGDTTAFRALYQAEREITFGFTLWMSTNHQPVLTGTDEGIRRRPVLIPFTYKIPKAERIQDYEKQLHREASGILNWCIEGLKRYQARGKLDRPEIVNAATDTFLRDNDPVGRFLEEVYTVDPQAKGADYCQPRYNVSALYSQWCKDEGREEVTPYKFAQRLRAAGIQDGQRTTQGRHWQGLKLVGLKEAHLCQ